MKGKIGGLLVLFLGLLFVAAGLVMKFAVVPMLAVWPDDVDSTRIYEGTLVTMLNPAALETMDVANLFLSNVPVVVDRHVTTEQVDGNKALVREVATMFGPGGEAIQGSEDWYTIDRRTTEHIANFTDNTMVKEARRGLVIGFPIGTEKRDYDGWTDDYQDLVKVEYQGVEEHEGMTAYRFTSQNGPRPIVDPSLLAMFPESLPRDVVAGLAPELGLSAEMMQQFAQILPTLPDPVPFTYLYRYETEYWVEPTTGVLIDYAKDEARILALEVDPAVISLGMVPVGEVFSLNYTASDQSIADAKDDAEDGKKLINLFGVIIPYAAIGLGALVGLGGAFMLFRKRRGAAA
ncbi:MAG: DUF3068 domain-containing protein [Acidimicrobiia bacterium]|nr:DUF3068 domain-containing protein [Acidimicrobiia bacterium]